MSERVKLTKADRTLLEISLRNTDLPRAEWRPRIDHAHSKWQPRLLSMRAAGLLAFTHAAPVIKITPAGRAALSPISEGNGERSQSQTVVSSNGETHAATDGED